VEQSGRAIDRRVVRVVFDFHFTIQLF
jgi:hypothetical protein